MSIVGTLKTDQASVEQVDSVAFVTCKSLPIVGCLFITALLSLPLLPDASSTIVFKEEG